MNDPDRDFNKDLDLHESEWTEAGKRQPIFGAGAGWFLKVTVPTIVCAVIIGIFTKWWVYFCIDLFGFPSGLFGAFHRWWSHCSSCLSRWLFSFPIYQI